MAFKDRLTIFLKKTIPTFSLSNRSPISILILKKYIIYLFFLIIFFFSYIFFVNQLNSYSKSKQNNLKAIITSSDFLDLKEYFINNLKSPYKEYKYIIKNNDSIEKILLNYNIKYSETKDIVNQLKKKELSNIYSGREVSIVIKENNENENSLINIIYPVSNTLTVEIRKKENTFKIIENIIKLSKKEVVVKNTIKNNLYSAAVEVGIEPNIIIEFA